MWDHIWAVTRKLSDLPYVIGPLCLSQMKDNNWVEKKWNKIIETEFPGQCITDRRLSFMLYPVTILWAPPWLAPLLDGGDTAPNKTDITLLSWD